MNKLLMFIFTVMLGYTAMSADAINIAFRDIEIMSDNVTTNVLFQGLATKDDVAGKIDRVLPDGRVFFEDSQAWEVVAESVPGCEIIVEAQQETPSTDEGTELTATLLITNYDDIVGAFVIPDRVKVNDTYHKVVTVTTALHDYNTRNNNRTVTSVSGGKYCETLGPYSFFRCSAITSVDLPNVTRLESYSMCLESAGSVSLSLPQVRYVGAYALSYIPYTTSISLPEATTVLDHAFLSCAKLERLYLPKVESIGQYAFSNTYVHDLTLCAYSDSVTANWPWGNNEDITINVPREHYEDWNSWASGKSSPSITVKAPADMADLGLIDRLITDGDGPGKTVLRLTQSWSNPDTVGVEVNMVHQSGGPRSFTFPTEGGTFATTNYVDSMISSVDVSEQIEPLQEAVESLQSGKQDTLTAGYGVKITDNRIALADDTLDGYATTDYVNEALEGVATSDSVEELAAGYTALTNQVYGSNVIFDIEGYEAGASNNTTELRIYEKAADGSRSKVYFSNDAIVAATNELSSAVSELIENYANTNFVMGVYNYEGDPKTSELRVSKLNSQGTYDVVYSSVGGTGGGTGSGTGGASSAELAALEARVSTNETSIISMRSDHYWMERALIAGTDYVAEPDDTYDGYIPETRVSPSVAGGKACESSTIIMTVERTDSFVPPTGSATLTLSRFGQFDRGNTYFVVSTVDGVTKVHTSMNSTTKYDFGVGKHIFIARYAKVSDSNTLMTQTYDGTQIYNENASGINGLNIWISGMGSNYTGLTFTTYVFNRALTNAEMSAINNSYALYGELTFEDYTLEDKTRLTLQKTRDTEANLQAQIDALASNYGIVATSEFQSQINQIVNDVAVLNEPDMVIFRQGEWVAVYDPAMSSSVVTNDLTVVTNNHTIMQYEISAYTDGKAVMKAMPISDDLTEVNLVSATAISGDANIDGLTISAASSGNHTPIIRVTDEYGSSRTVMVALSQSVESTKTSKVYTSDSDNTFRKKLNDEALAYILEAEGDDTTQLEGTYAGTTTYTVGLNSYYTSGSTAWNPNCYIPPSLCSIITFKSSNSSFAQGGQWTNSGGGPCFAIGKRLMANANHFGGTGGVHTRRLMRPNGEVVTIQTTGRSWRLSDWVRDNYGDYAEEALGSDTTQYGDIQLYETATDIPDDCIPYLLPYDIATNHFTVASNGSLELGVAGFSLSQINSVIPIGATYDRTYMSLPYSMKEYFRNDICEARKNYNSWGVVSGDSGHPVFFSMNAKPVIIGLWTYPNLGPSFIRAVRAIEALETANGRDPSTSLKVLTEEQIQTYISQ